MLSYAKITADRADYYLTAVAHGVDDYYLGAGEVPGRWAGGGATALDLAGRVGDDAFRAVLAGVDPASGEALGRRWGTETVAGWDFTFTDPKSVSLLFGTADDATRRLVTDAHDRSVSAVLAYMEDTACYVRRGKGGAERMPATGFVAAAFRHRCSRCGDPNLHTHLILANRAQGVDGRWSALDGREFTDLSKTLGMLYRAHLRHELAPLGLAWEMRPDGLAEVDGIPADVLAAFSKRRAEIEEALDERGLLSPQAAQAAALDTRRRKEHQVDPDLLRSRWRAEAAAAGWGGRELDRLLSDGARRVADGAIRDSRNEERVSAADRLLGLPDPLAVADGSPCLTYSRSTFGEKELLQGIATHCVAGISIGAARQLGSEVLDDRRAVQVGTVGRAMRGGVPVGAGAARYTTADLLEVERALLAVGEQAVGTRVAVVDAGALNAAIDARPYLSAEQVMAVRELGRRGDGIATLAALGGSGKTSSMRTLAEAYAADGYTPVGACLAARAAGVLRDEAGIPTFTLAQLDRAAAAGGLGWTGRHVLFVDEAGQVGTRQLARIVTRVRAAGGKVILLGDTLQLPEIEAGGMFRGLVRRLRRVTMTGNHRQTDPGEQDRLAQLRHGDVEAAVRSYADAGRIIQGPDGHATRETLVDDWLAATDPERVPENMPGNMPAPPDEPSPTPFDRTVMLGLTNADVDDLNRRARSRLAALGRLTGPEVSGVRVGDHVVTRRNKRRLGVLNGERWTVTAVDPASGRVDLAGVHGEAAQVPGWYAEAHVRPAYAWTVAMAQGSTVDRAFVLGSDATYRQAGYVAASRAREATRWYVTAPLDVADPDVCSLPEPARVSRETPEPDVGRDPLEAMTVALSRSRLQALASETPAGVPRPTAEAGEVTRVTSLRGLAAERTALLTALGTPDADAGWAAAHRPQLDRLHQLDQLDQRRRANLARAAAADPPADLVALIGPPPAEPGEQRQAWLDAAGAAEAFRELAAAVPPADGQLRLDQPTSTDLVDLLAAPTRDGLAAAARTDLGDALAGWEQVRDLELDTPYSGMSIAD